MVREPLEMRVPAYTRVEEAQADRAPIQTVTTAFTRRFVPVSFASRGSRTSPLDTPDGRSPCCSSPAPAPRAWPPPTAISAAIGDGARCRRGVVPGHGIPDRMVLPWRDPAHSRPG
ncbi:hypothetical protein GCM10018780_02970 [Streptomyces lanatus]|nr:hypothetical protein GCM10018780_02970 [Streptomyces lanatus]